MFNLHAPERLNWLSEKVQWESKFERIEPPAEKIGKIGVNRIRLIEFGFEQMVKSWTDSRIRHLFVIRFSRQYDSIYKLSDDQF